MTRLKLILLAGVVFPALPFLNAAHGPALAQGEPQLRLAQGEPGRPDAPPPAPRRERPAGERPAPAGERPPVAAPPVGERPPAPVQREPERRPATEPRPAPPPPAAAPNVPPPPRPAAPPAARPPEQAPTTAPVPRPQATPQAPSRPPEAAPAPRPQAAPPAPLGAPPATAPTTQPSPPAARPQPPASQAPPQVAPQAAPPDSQPRGERRPPGTGEGRPGDGRGPREQRGPDQRGQPPAANAPAPVPAPGVPVPGPLGTQQPRPGDPASPPPLPRGAGAPPAGATVQPPVAQGTQAPPPTPSAATIFGRGQSLQDFRGQRREVQQGNRTVFQEPGRTIIREGDRTIIRRNEADRFRFNAQDVRTERRGNEFSTITVRPDGTQIVTVTDNDGRLLRRSRRDPRGGRDIVIIDNVRRGAAAGLFINVAPPRVTIPRERYIVETDDADRELIYETLAAPPVERIERRYSLDEIRYSAPLRDRMRRVDIDTVTFGSGSWEVSADQVDRLTVIADAINRAVQRNPNEVFMIEGHTDAVGPDLDNLSLSDRRAESVALVLSDRFNVPPENLTTQGYGEQYLKIASEGDERANRRVTVRRITPLLGQAAAPPAAPAQRR